MTIPRTLLVLFDGWGLSEAVDANAIALARTPAYDALCAGAATSRLSASGEDVGLPAGLMGNSEVGHLNIGAGRVIEQDLLRIDRAVQDGSLGRRPAVAALMAGVARRGRALHLMGLVSDGGVHSHESHLHALVEAARDHGVGDLRVHAFLDGRDTPPRSALGYLARLEDCLARVGVGRIATVGGRYYAMDRDRRWERVELAWRAIVDGAGPRAASARAAVEAGYAAGLDDEFVLPTVIRPEGAASTVDAGDAVFYFNYRADRARQLTTALSAENFDGFSRGPRPDVSIVTMTRYDSALDVPVVFEPQSRADILADVIAGTGESNLRVAETEKYAHVTYFFNGGSEAPWPGESRILVPSPRVATYDQQPEMSAAGITDAIVSAMGKGQPPVIICNYANADMVGHTGNLDATVRAVEALDTALGRLLTAARSGGYALFLTSDHGNAEQMRDPKTGAPHTAHTTNPVPLLAVAGPAGRRLHLGDGRLADVAPTLIDYWGLEQPALMTGSSLLRRS